jgi:hypothetical protein
MSSWSSKALPWLIPTLLLTSPPGRRAVLVSPWAEDVLLRVYRWEGVRAGRLEGEVPLSRALRWLAEERGMRFLLILRERDARSEALARAAGEILTLREVPDLHAKAIITDRLVLRTSANLLARSLTQNVELLHLASNPRGDALAFLREELGRFGIRLAP